MSKGMQAEKAKTRRKWKMGEGNGRGGHESETGGRKTKQGDERQEMKATTIREREENRTRRTKRERRKKV